MSRVLIASCEMGTLLGSSSFILVAASSVVMTPAFATLTVSLLATLFRLRFAAITRILLNLITSFLIIFKMFFVTCAWWSWSYGFRCGCQPCHTLVRRFCCDNYTLVERFTQHKLEAADIKLFGADCVNGVK